MIHSKSDHLYDVKNINKKVFGESILNDAVSIVLCNIMIKLGKDTTDAGFGVLLSALVEFSQLMVLSAFLGIFSALVCALVLKLGCQKITLTSQ